jgi:hypothetical protein
VGNLTSGLDRIGHFWESPGTLPRGLSDVGVGLVETVGGAVFGGVELGADWIKDKTDDIPVVHQLAGPLADLLHGGGAVGADVVHTVGQVGEDLGEGIEKLGKGDVIGALG